MVQVSCRLVSRRASQPTRLVSVPACGILIECFFLGHDCHPRSPGRGMASHNRRRRPNAGLAREVAGCLGAYLGGCGVLVQAAWRPFRARRWRGFVDCGCNWGLCSGEMVRGWKGGHRVEQGGLVQAFRSLFGRDVLHSRGCSPHNMGSLSDGRAVSSTSSLGSWLMRWWHWRQAGNIFVLRLVYESFLSSIKGDHTLSSVFAFLISNERANKLQNERANKLHIQHL